jgi:hypothetical protein
MEGDWDPAKHTRIVSIVRKEGEGFSLTVKRSEETRGTAARRTASEAFVRNVLRNPPDGMTEVSLDLIRDALKLQPRYFRFVLCRLLSSPCR